MRRVSLKRAALLRSLKAKRQAMKESAGECMVCHRRLPPDSLDCDEIARGHAREKCLDEPLLILVSCRGCHDLTQNWTPTERIALRVRWLIDQVAARYCELRGTARTYVTGAEIVDALYAREV